MTATAMRLLLIEDSPGDARLLYEMVRESETAPDYHHVLTLKEADAFLATHAVDVIVLDLGLPDGQGLQAVRRVRAAAPWVALVVLTGRDDEKLATQALQHGAQDYLVKGQIETRSLVRALRYAIERTHMEAALEAARGRAIATLNCIGDAVACTDTTGIITFLNSAAEALTGWSPTEAVGQPLAKIFRVLDASNRMPVLSSHDRSTPLPFNCVLLRRDGSETPVEDSVAPLSDAAGTLLGSVVAFRDVTAARTMAQAMAHNAHHDALTGLPNRILLNDRISQAVARAPHHSNRVALLFLDLNGFKHINDSLGHPIGDRLLRSVADRLVAAVRPIDTVSRQGGDEFVILLTEPDEWNDAAAVARHLLARLALPHLIDGLDLRVSASLGISIYPDDGHDAETLLKSADTAMYQAKEDGQQGYRFFTPAMNTRAVARQSLEGDLRRAMPRREFALHYQPKFDLTTGMLTGAEALVRWNHPVRGMVSPADFIPIAEECGLIVPIGRWVLNEACRQAQAWAILGLSPGTIAVNVSAKEFLDEDFLASVFAALERTGLDPAALELEITESALMKRVEAVGATLAALQAHNIQIALDDFGTGFSSLSYLQRFAVDTLKIDQSFVRQIGDGIDEETVVIAIINLAHNLGLQVVAEGVETPVQLDFLRRHRCEQAQGYLLARPMAAAQFRTLLETGAPSAAGAPTPRRHAPQAMVA